MDGARFARMWRVSSWQQRSGRTPHTPSKSCATSQTTHTWATTGRIAPLFTNASSMLACGYRDATQDYFASPQCMKLHGQFIRAYDRSACVGFDPSAGIVQSQALLNFTARLTSDASFVHSTQGGVAVGNRLRSLGMPSAFLGTRQATWPFLGAGQDKLSAATHLIH